MSGGYPIRVASIPAAHPYVEHLADPDDGRVQRLPDPPPDVPDPLPGQWWPPVMLDPAWITGHRREIDVVHLHFGFDSIDPRRLRTWTDTLQTLDLPLVFTVHDLVNPHFDDQSRHRAQLDVLVPAAAALITLTPGAAAEISARWSRTAKVVPHPHVVTESRLGEPRPRRRGTRHTIGVSVKNLRTNLDPVPVLQEISRLLPGLPSVVLQVDGHHELLDPARTDARVEQFRGWLVETADDPAVEIRLHDRFSDDELHDYLAALDLCVLPYRFGTHSGWLEACVDVGTPVLVPDVGHYTEQHGHPVYRLPDARGGVAPPLADQVRRAVAEPGYALRTPPDRHTQRQAIAAAHLDVYRSVLRGTTEPSP